MRIPACDGYDVVQTDDCRKGVGCQGAVAESATSVEAPAEWNANGHQGARVEFANRDGNGVGETADGRPRSSKRHCEVGAELPAVVGAPTERPAIGLQSAGMRAPEGT